ncbi:hypothetical protein [Streptomyces sp. NPDC055109]
MADDDMSADGNGDRPDPMTPPSAPMEVEIHFVDSLPGGRVIMPVEREGKFAWLAVRGHISRQAAREMVADLNYIIKLRLWRQDWEPPKPE